VAGREALVVTDSTWVPAMGAGLVMVAASAAFAVPGPGSMAGRGLMGGTVALAVAG